VCARVVATVGVGEQRGTELEPSFKRENKCDRTCSDHGNKQRALSDSVRVIRSLHECALVCRRLSGSVRPWACAAGTAVRAVRVQLCCAVLCASMHVLCVRAGSTGLHGVRTLVIDPVVVVRDWR
jgi:hypothetical protein